MKIKKIKIGEFFFKSHGITIFIRIEVVYGVSIFIVIRKKTIVRRKNYGFHPKYIRF